MCIRDSHYIFLITLAAGGLFLIWNSFVAINKNYLLQLRVNELREEIAQLDIDNENLELQNEYLETDEFLERAARQQLGFAAEGETVFLEPNAVLDALRNPTTDSSSPAESVAAEDVGWRSNLGEWWQFLFNR